MQAHLLTIISSIIMMRVAMVVIMVLCASAGAAPGVRRASSRLEFPYGGGQRSTCPAAAVASTPLA